MVNPNRVSEKQQKFLRALRDEPVLVSDLMERFSISERQLQRWQRGVGFGRALREIEGALRRGIRLSLRAAARVAAEALAENVKQKPEDLSPNLVAVMEKAINQDRAEARLARSRRGRRRRAREPEDLCHPNQRHRGAELLRKLQSSQREGAD